MQPYAFLGRLQKWSKKAYCREMLKEGLAMDLIIKITRLTHPEIEDLKRNL
jgi:hypothetical protein